MRNEPERLADNAMTRWLGLGDVGYQDFADYHPEFLCPRCAVLFALDVDNRIVAVCHELSCPAR